MGYYCESLVGGSNELGPIILCLEATFLGFRFVSFQ